MTPRRWFFLMLLTPLLIPLFFGALGHLYSSIEFYDEIKDLRVHESFDHGTSRGSSVDFIGKGPQAFFFHVMLPVGRFGLPFLVMQMAMTMGGTGYLLFLIGLYGWGRKKSVSALRKTVWWLPFIYLPFFYLGTIINTLLLTNSLHIDYFDVGLIFAIPFILFFGYIYVGIACALTPKKYYHA